MNFGEAIQAMKSGKKAARAGWNGKGMFIFKTDIFVFGASDDVIKELTDKGIVHLDKGIYSTCLCMKTADNNLVFGWLASQSDILAEDWEIL
jgi:hypothetical protein